VFDGLRRRFTVKASKDKHVQLLYLNKKDLIHMRTEFPDCFEEFFESGFEELEKILNLRIHVMEHCTSVLKRAILGFQNWRINKLDNIMLSKMTPQELEAFCKENYNSGAKSPQKLMSGVRVSNVLEISNKEE
jgi:hypothetical protein